MVSLSVLLMIACLIVLLLSLGVGGFVVLLKLGVIVRESSRPIHHDHGSYTLDQGREVRSEDDRAP